MGLSVIICPELPNKAGWIWEILINKPAPCTQRGHSNWTRMAHASTGSPYVQHLNLTNETLSAMSANIPLPLNWSLLTSEMYVSLRLRAWRWNISLKLDLSYITWMWINSSIYCDGSKSLLWSFIDANNSIHFSHNEAMYIRQITPGFAVVKKICTSYGFGSNMW